MSKIPTYKVKPGEVLPPPNRSPKQSAARKYPFDSMKVGELIFVPDKEVKKFASHVGSQGRKLGRKFSTQTAVMRQDLKTDQWEVCKPDAPGAKKGVAIRRTT